MLIQINPRFQSVRASLGLIMLVSTLAILLPQVNVVKRADTTNPSLSSLLKNLIRNHFSASFCDFRSV